MKDMVENQIVSRGITDPMVLQAMRDVNRSLFVPDSEKEYSYEDSPLPIGYGQTISQPYIVAYMTEKLKLESSFRVLEIGTGSGYQSAILSRIVSQVYSIERISELAIKAQTLLKMNNFVNIRVREADGFRGWEEMAPFDAIITTAAAPIIPKPLINQLNDPGRLIIPIGPDSGIQYLYLIIKEDKKLFQKRLIAVRFVPFISENF